MAANKKEMAKHPKGNFEIVLEYKNDSAKIVNFVVPISDEKCNSKNILIDSICIENELPINVVIYCVYKAIKKFPEADPVWEADEKEGFVNIYFPFVKE